MGKNLAMHGGPPVRRSPFPSWPVFGEAEEHRLTRALRSGKWGRLDGEEVAHFERRFADYHQARHGIAVVNGTVALRLALLAAGIAYQADGDNKNAATQWQELIEGYPESTEAKAAKTRLQSGKTDSDEE